MLNLEKTVAVSGRGMPCARLLVAAIALAVAMAFSAWCAPSAFAAQLASDSQLTPFAAETSQLAPRAAGNLSVSGNTITCTQTSLGYQVIPVTLKAGAVRLDFSAGKSDASVGVYASASSDGSYSGMVSFMYASTPYATGFRFGNIAKSGTYYVMFYASQYSGATGSKLTITQYPYEATKTAALNGATLGTGCGDNNKVTYYKLTVKKRGLITLNVEDATGEGYSSSVRLCNAKKKSLTGSYYDYTSSDRPVYYGVKKGTYYLAVKSYTSLYRVKPKFTATTLSVKTKKSKATTIKKGKKTKAVMAAGEKVAWFKFKVTKKKAYKITLTGKLNNGVRMTFSGKGYYAGSGYLPSGAATTTIKTNKLKKGTYYVKVTPTSSGNGLYTITWK